MFRKGLAAPLFEINAGVLLLIATAFAARQATAAWNVSMTAPRRLIETTEQNIHSVLEMMPFSVASLYVASHWDKLRGTLGHPGARDFRLRFKQPHALRAPGSGLCSAITLLDFLAARGGTLALLASETKRSDRKSRDCLRRLTCRGELPPAPSSPPAGRSASTPQTRPEAVALW